MQLLHSQNFITKHATHANDFCFLKSFFDNRLSYSVKKKFVAGICTIDIQKINKKIPENKILTLQYSTKHLLLTIQDSAHVHTDPCLRNWAISSKKSAIYLRSVICLQ